MSQRIFDYHISAVKFEHTLIAWLFVFIFFFILHVSNRVTSQFNVRGRHTTGNFCCYYHYYNTQQSSHILLCIEATSVDVKMLISLARVCFNIRGQSDISIWFSAPALLHLHSDSPPVHVYTDALQRLAEALTGPDNRLLLHCSLLG